MVFKALVYKNPPYEGAFPCITYGELYSGDRPVLMSITSTMEDIKKYYRKSIVDFNQLELKEIEVYVKE